MHRGFVRSQDSHDTVRLIADGTDLRHARDLGVDVEEARDASGRRSVEDDRVVRAGMLLVTTTHQLHRLAGEQHVTQARRDGGDELHCTHTPQDATGATKVVEEFEVFEQCLLGVDRQTPHLAASGRGGELALLVGHRWRVEELGEALPALDLHEHHVATLACERQSQRCGHRGLACAALARDHVQDHVGPIGRGHRLSLVRAGASAPVVLGVRRTRVGP